MRELGTRTFWTAQIPLWRVVLVVLALGTLPGFGAAAILSNRISDQAQEQLTFAQRQLRAGCERGNLLRSDLNARGEGLRVLQEGLIDFMAQARRARMNPHGTSYDPRLADRYQRDISKVASVPYTPFPLVNCSNAFRFATAHVAPLRPRAALIH